MVEPPDITPADVTPQTSGGCRIWATRPVEQNGSWANSLRSLLRKSAAEGAVVELPLMEIEPVIEAEEVQSVKNLILDFDQFHKVIFVSQNAVREAFAWLRDYWPQLPLGVEYFAVGRKTADAVVAEGVAVQAASQAMNSDELLALPQLQNSWGQKILICRGRGGLPRLGEVLHERGAIVRYCELYHRRLPASAAEQAAPLLVERASLRGLELVPLFSGETLQNLLSVLTANGCVDRSMTLLVPGKRVLQLAQRLGFANVLMAENAAAATMLAAVAGWLQHQRMASSANNL